MGRPTIFAALAIMMMMPLANPEASKVGSDGDPIRQGLFASQPLSVLVQRLKLDGSPGPFQTIADASELAKAGKTEEAKSLLRSILLRPNLETRIQLWVWSGLRELGEQPDAKSGGEVLGVVIEVPMHEAYDTLAAYQDGSARYLNFSGAAIFWDAPDPTIQSLCRRFIESSASAGSQARSRKDVSLPRSGIQVTLLTRAGMFAIPNPPQSVIAAASNLMMEMMRRANEKKQVKTN
jgi:hypothetical protein